MICQQQLKHLNRIHQLQDRDQGVVRELHIRGRDDGGEEGHGRNGNGRMFSLRRTSMTCLLHPRDHRQILMAMHHHLHLSMPMKLLVHLQEMRLKYMRVLVVNHFAWLNLNISVCCRFVHIIWSFPHSTQGCTLASNNDSLNASITRSHMCSVASNSLSDLVISLCPTTTCGLVIRTTTIPSTFPSSHETDDAKKI